MVISAVSRRYKQRPLMSWASTLIYLFLLLAWPAGWAAAQPVAEADPPAQEADPAEEAQAFYKDLEQLFLQNRFDPFMEKRKAVRPHLRHLSRDQKLSLQRMARESDDYDPKWWPSTRSPDPVTFKAKIWGKTITANYKPDQYLGAQYLVAKREYRRTRVGYQWFITDIHIIVTWRPRHVDSKTPAEGKLAKIHGYTNGDLAEVIVWHELGHNFISSAFSAEDIIELYTKHERTFRALQEFYADMTALAHASPKARRAVLQMRLHELDRYDSSEEHRRGAHGVGAIFLHDVLQNPDAWPSIRLPPSVPQQQAELNTLIYVYENWKPDWSYPESVRLRELAQDYIKKYGNSTFRKRGRVALPNRLTMQLIDMDDRELQEKRDAWVAKRLQQLINTGYADPPNEAKPYNPPIRDTRRRIRVGGTADEPRMEFPRH